MIAEAFFSGQEKVIIARFPTGLKKSLNENFEVCINLNHGTCFSGMGSAVIRGFVSKETVGLRLWGVETNAWFYHQS